MDQPPSPEQAVARKKASGRNNNRLLFAVAAVAGIAWLAFRTLVSAYNIPSGAMFPTLQLGDRIFATRYALFGTPLPRRGEVVVFQYPDPNPNNDPQDFVKRVIALPGDQLEVDASVPIINGFRVPRCSLGATEALVGDERVRLEIVVEFLEGNAYLLAIDPARPAKREGPYHVQAGEFYTLGDNRDNSSDSRYWNGGRGGGVPFENLERRASWVWWPSDGSSRSINGQPQLPASLGALQPAFDGCLAKAPAQSTPPPPAAR